MIKKLKVYQVEIILSKMVIYKICNKTDWNLIKSIGFKNNTDVLKLGKDLILITSKAKK